MSHQRDRNWGNSFRDLPSDLWELRKGELRPVEVAVLDSGIDATHPALEGRIISAHYVHKTEEHEELREAPADEDNDAFGHGTNVASIIAGIAPNARLVDIRVLRPHNRASGSALITALKEAVNRGCPVINMSLAATSKFSRGLHPLLETAYRQGQVVVAAKRNTVRPDLGFPAELSSSISVDSTRTEGIFHLLYRAGEVIEFAADGEEIEAASAGGGYTRVTGTSFATPIVSAVCALLLGARPDLRPFEVKTLLKAYAAL